MPSKWNQTKKKNTNLFCIFYRYSETTESRSTSPPIYLASVSSQSQSSNSLAPLSTPAVPLGQIQSQVSNTPYNSFQPQITSFLHQFEQFANNKSVCIFLTSLLFHDYFQFVCFFRLFISEILHAFIINKLYHMFVVITATTSPTGKTIISETNSAVIIYTTSSRTIINHWTGE